MQRDAQLLVGLEQLGVHLVEALGLVFLTLGRAEIRDRLIVDGRIVQMGPGRRGHLQPLTVGVQAPIEHPLRLTLLLGDEGDGVFIQPRRDRVALDVGHESFFIFATDELFHFLTCHDVSPPGRFGRRALPAQGNEVDVDEALVRLPPPG